MNHHRTLLRSLPSRRRQQLRRTVRRPFWGNLRRLDPISDSFGYDRGIPIDRYYMRDFLTTHAAKIRGVAAEVSGSDYLDEFGDGRLDQVEVIDIAVTNDRATIIGDLSQPDSLGSATFDCLVITQTLQYSAEPEQVLATCISALRPGGTLLLAVPALTAHDSREDSEGDYWRFWPAGVLSLLRRVAPEARHTVTAYGNLVAAIAFLHGLSAEELRPSELRHRDERFPVVICARTDMPGMTDES